MDKSREQFEAWFRRFGSEDECTNMLQLNSYGTNYLHPHADLAWIAWQASRAAIELDIDWPEANDDHWKEGEEGAYARGHEDGKDKVSLAVRKALSAAGLKVKGDDSGETDILSQK